VIIFDRGLPTITVIRLGSPLLGGAAKTNSNSLASRYELRGKAWHVARLA